MLRAIREIQPTFVVGENVRGLLNWSGGLVFEQVQIDLETEGYEVTPFLLPACALNAPHRRDRVWFVAHTIGSRHGGITEATGSDQSECSRGMATDERHNGNQVWGETERCGQAIENTNQDGRDDFRGEEEPKERGFRDAITGDRERVYLHKGTTPDTRHTEPQGRVITKEGQQFGRGGQTRSKPASSGGSSDAPDTENVRIQGSGSTWEQKSESHVGEALLVRSSSRGDWSEWPTQPPVCSRNDGLSPELSGITVPKHRKESIMAYGNAIVPQVAFEIFKTIVK